MVLENPRHERFAQALAQGLPAVRAYVAAGYRESDSSATQLFQKPRIQERVTELLTLQASAAGVDRTYVMGRLRQLAERCMQAEPVLDREGRPTGMYTFQAQAARGALHDLKDMLPPEPEVLPAEKPAAPPAPLQLVRADAVAEAARRKAQAG